MHNYKLIQQQKRIFISWILDSTRSDSLAYYIGARSYTIHFPFLKKRIILLAPLKYIYDSFKSLRILKDEKPDIIFVQNPPVFSGEAY